MFGFTGEPTDANGLVQLRARYYNPALGVFPSLDPVEGGMVQPMGLNRYGYVAGDVVNAVDPSGLHWWNKAGAPDLSSLDLTTATQTDLQSYISKMIQLLELTTVPPFDKFRHAEYPVELGYYTRNGIDLLFVMGNQIQYFEIKPVNQRGAASGGYGSLESKEKFIEFYKPFFNSVQNPHPTIAFPYDWTPSKGFTWKRGNELSGIPRIPKKKALGPVEGDSSTFWYYGLFDDGIIVYWPENQKDESGSNISAASSSAAASLGLRAIPRVVSDMLKRGKNPGPPKPPQSGGGEVSIPICISNVVPFPNRSTPVPEKGGQKAASNTGCILPCLNIRGAVTDAGQPVCYCGDNYSSGGFVPWPSYGPYVSPIPVPSSPSSGQVPIPAFE